MIFKLQVEEFVLCGCHFKMHSEDRREARPLFLLQGPRSGSEDVPPLMSVHPALDSLGTRASALEVEAEGELGGVLVPCERDQISLILRG